MILSQQNMSYSDLRCSFDLTFQYLYSIIFKGDFKKTFWYLGLSLLKTWTLVVFFCNAEGRGSYCEKKADAKTSGNGIVPLQTVCLYWRKCVWKRLGLSHKVHFLLHLSRMFISLLHDPCGFISETVESERGWETKNDTFSFCMLWTYPLGMHDNISMSSVLANRGFKMKYWHHSKINISADDWWDNTLIAQIFD